MGRPAFRHGESAAQIAHRASCLHETVVTARTQNGGGGTTSCDDWNGTSCTRHQGLPAITRWRIGPFGGVSALSWTLYYEVRVAAGRSNSLTAPDRGAIERSPFILENR